MPANCLGCGVIINTKPREQGGGTRRKWCSHKCASREWHRNNKTRSNEIKRKSSEKPSCKLRKHEYVIRCKQWLRTTPEYKMWSGAKARARKKNLEFAISVDDVKIPAMCPLLGVPLVRKSGKNGNCGPNSPSLDRKNPEKGYVPNNIWVISHMANTAKSNLSLFQLKKLVDALEHVLVEAVVNERT
jgi:hypothetical protein